MAKSLNFFGSMTAVAGLGLLTGCSTPQVTNDYAPGGGESIFRTVDKSESLYRSEQAECVALFNHNKDQTGFNGSMLHVTIKPGSEIPSRIAPDSEIIYAAKGSGMAKLNGVAFILTEGAGLYVPKGSTLVVVNNGQGDLKIMALCRQIPNIKWTSPVKPLVFDTKSAGQQSAAQTMGKSEKDKTIYNELIPPVPEKLSNDKIKAETLTPDENRINTLSGEGFK